MPFPFRQFNSRNQYSDRFFNKFECYKELCKYEYPVVSGKADIPDKPGIGNELSEIAFKNCDKLVVS